MKIDLKKDYSKNLWAVCVIVLGIILLGNYLTLWNVTLFFKGWWTLFFIIPSFISLFDNDGVGEKLTTAVVLLSGVLFLAKAQGWLGENVEIGAAIFALIIVRVGIGMILKKSEFDSNIREQISSNAKMDRNVGVFGGGKSDYTNQEYNGGEAVGIFGGAELDLRKAIIDKDIYIDATAIFGGVEIHVPKEACVKVNSTNIFGGTDNKANVSEGKYTIYINTTAIFGGVDIK